MRILDAFCKAGGAGMGYKRAGFEVIGVDIEPQPNFPFAFIQGDAVEYIKSHWHEFDAIHASPPCQKFSRVQSLGRARNGTYREHTDWIEATRAVLQYADIPYVIENVMGAPLREPIVLCGVMFPALRVYRHRGFECSFPIEAPRHTPHNDRTPSAGNGKSPKGYISVCGSGGVRGMNSKEIVSYWGYAMGIEWMTRSELAQAIPPAYTEYVGRALLKYLNAKENANAAR